MGDGIGNSQHDLTVLLQDWRRSDQTALDKLVPLVNVELRRLAHIYLTRDRPGHLLQTSALINEAYLRLIDAQAIDWQSRAHFFTIAAKLMRRTLVEFARARGASKRRGELHKVCIRESFVASRECARDLIAIDDALNSLAAVDPRQARIVKLRFFGGLSEDETAEAQGVSRLTVLRNWKSAKLWLLHEQKHRGAT